MASKRMSLVEGMRRDEEELDVSVAENFVKFGNAQPKPKTTSEQTAEPKKTLYATNLPPVEPPPPQPKRTPKASKQSAVITPGLISVNVRVRPEIATALQTATLQRQLQGIEPSSKREIVEEALEPWLRDNGYL
jgi:hypothetical protein